MAAAYTDLFTEVGDPGTATTLSSPGYTSGVSTTVTVGSTSGWPTATGVIFVIDEVSTVDGVEVRTDGTYNEYSGTVTNGTLISNVTWERGDGNRNYPAGATTRVYIGLANEWGNRMAQGMVVAHAQDGKLAATGGSLTSPKIITALNDTNDNELLKVTATGSAVNELTLANAATGNGPALSATGGDTNIDLIVTPKGTGKALIDSFYSWQRGTGTWTYASATTFTVPAVDAALMSAGTKLWFTQTTSKYFYVASVSGTTVTIDANADYTLANAAITAPYFSNAATPIGFPDWFNWTATLANLTLGNGSVATKYNRVGKTIHLRFNFTLGSTSAVGTGPTFTLPATSATFDTQIPLGNVHFEDAGVAGYAGMMERTSTTVANFNLFTSGGTYVGLTGVSATQPHTWATSDEINASGTYEAA